MIAGVAVAMGVGAALGDRVPRGVGVVSGRNTAGEKGSQESVACDRCRWRMAASFPKIMQDVHTGLRSEARTRLLKAARAQGVPAECCHIGEGPPAGEIRRLACR